MVMTITGQRKCIKGGLIVIYVFENDMDRSHASIVSQKKNVSFVLYILKQI